MRTGAWSYTLDDANTTVQALNAGDTLHELVTVATADGTTQVIDVTINGANDAAVISNLTVTDSQIGFVATDPDNATLSLANPFATPFASPAITSGATTNLTPAAQAVAVSGTLQVTDGSATADLIGLYLGTSSGDSFTAGSTSTAIYGFGGQ